MLIFLDTETTGTSEFDRLCQVAYKTEHETICEYFKPPLPISLEAMAVNHITNEMVEQRLPFKNSLMYYKLETLFADPDNILVAHNAKFDVDMLIREGLNPTKYICTQKIIKAADKTSKIKRYGLQYLRYYFNVVLKENIIAHDALGDILILEQVFFHIYNRYYYNTNPKTQILNELAELTKLPLLLHNISFGKYKGKSFTYILECDIGYLKWLNKQPDIDEDLQYTLDHYLNIKY